MQQTQAVTNGPAGTVARKRVPQNGAAIRSLREKDGYRQGTFAEAVGLSQPSLANIENEKRSASVITLNRIARKLRVPVAAIMRELAEESAA